MLHRRDCLLGALGTLAVGGTGVAAPLADPIQAALKQTVGAREKVVGTVAVVFDESGITTVAYGNTDAPNVAMDIDAVFEIGSITKIMTALLLADMVSRGELAMDDPVSKYLPVKLHERGRAITLQDLANYNSGLPKLPPNLPANWFVSPDPFADFTARDWQ
jgi:CubicO group peptidase (beta-lactamase class C family)